MTIKSSGSLNLTEIDGEFVLGKTLGTHRGVTWYTDTFGESGTFTQTNLGVNQFYSKRKDQPIPPSPPGSTPFVFQADWAQLSYYFTDGQDLDTRTKITSPNVGGGYMGWAQADSQAGIATWGGDNTGTGFEAVLFNMGAFRSSYPNQAIDVDCRAQWYGSVGSNVVRIQASLWTGGSPVKSGYAWVNPGATNLLVYSAGVVISYYSQNGGSLGVHVADFHYDPVSSSGWLL